MQILQTRVESNERACQKKTFLSIIIPKLLIHKIVTSFSSKVFAVGIVATQMAHTTSSTKIAIEFIFNIACIRLAPCTSIEVLIHTIQFLSVSRFDDYKDKRKLKNTISIVFNMQISKMRIFEFIKIELTKLIFGSFYKFYLMNAINCTKIYLSARFRIEPDEDCARGSTKRLSWP